MVRLIEVQNNYPETPEPQIEQKTTKKPVNPLTYVRGVFIFAVVFQVLVALLFNETEAERFEKLQEKDRKAIEYMINASFTHVTLFNNFCEKNGYKLVTYPDAYTTLFAEELDVLDKKLTKEKISLKTAYKTVITPEVAKSSTLDVEEFIEALRKEVILSELSRQRGMMVSIWNRSYNDVATTVQICKLIDYNADKIIKQERALVEKMREFARVLK